MKNTLLLFFSLLLGTVSMAQETKVIIRGAKGLGKFYIYVDNELINRAPQLQVGILDLEAGITYNFRAVFQDSSRMPLTGTFTPKFERTKLYVLYGGNMEEVADQKADTTNLKAIHGNTAPSHPAMPRYKGRLGCDYPIDNGVVEQVISQMTSFNKETPINIAITAIQLNCFSVAQFHRMLNALPNNEDRIKLSKAAWYYLYDQDNFHTLTTVFSHPDDMEEILNFVQRNQ